MREVRMILRGQIECGFHSIKFWIAVLFQIALGSFYGCNLLNFSNRLDEPVNIFDGFYLSAGSSYVCLIQFMIFLLIISDLPFRNRNTLEELLRANRIQWSLGKILYIPFCAMMMQLLMVGVSTAILSSNGFIQNIWSRPFYHIIISGGSSILQYSGVNVIAAMSPVGLVVLQTLLMSLYETGQGLLLYVLCIYVKKSVAYSLVISLQIAGFLMNFFNIFQVLPFPHAMLTSMFSKSGNGSNPVRGIAYQLMVIASMVLILQIRRIKGRHYDLD